MATKPAKKAFNIDLLTNDRKILLGMGQVTSAEIFNAQKDFHEDGIYSTQIFGRIGSKTRMKKHGWIDLKTKILHPKIFMELCSLKQLYRGILQGVDYARWDNELKDFVKADIIEGNTGYAFFMTHFTEIQFKRTKSAKRSLVIDLVEKYRENHALMNFLIVAPAGLRELQEDEQGRPVEEELNPMYRSVLAATNVIEKALQFKNDPVLNRPRWNIQLKVNAIWDTIMGILHGNGKNGFLRAKWASRRVAYATANVISAMDPAGLSVNSPRGYDLTETLFGVFQMMKGNEPLIAIHQMRTGIAREMIESGGEDAPLVDMKTLKRVHVSLSEKQMQKWCTEAGRVGLMNGFKILDVRSNPIIIDGHYLALVFETDNAVRIVYGVDEIPSHLRDKGELRPITWGEYFYIETHAIKDRTRAFITRYPVADDGSNYPSKPYLRSTEGAKLRYTYDENWALSPDVKWEEYPMPGKAWFNTMSVSQYYIQGLGADYDGDRTQALFVNSNEAVAEVDAKLDSKEHYLDTHGNLKNSFGVETIERVCRSFTPYK